MKRLAVVLVCAVFLAGCKDPYGACEKAALDIANGIASGMKTVDGLRVAGLISPAEESSVLGYLKFANDSNASFSTCAEAAHTNGSKAGAFTSCAQSFNTALNNPQELALLHVTNPQALQEVQVVVNGVTAGVGALLTALGGK